MEAVKAFVKGYTTSKTSTRKKLLLDLRAAAESGDLPSPVVKASVQALGNTLFLYIDRCSRLGVEQVLDKLCSQYGGVAVSGLSTVIDKVCPYFSPPAGPAMNKSALTALHWSIVVSRHSKEINDVIITSQAILLTATLPHDPTHSSRVWREARKQLHSLWRSKPGLVQEYFNRLLAREGDLPSLCLLSALAEHCSKTDHTLDNTQQEAMLDYYRKTVLASRAKPFQHIVASCGALFKRVTHKQFSSHLLSPSLKCLLRNPDELLEAVAHMVRVLPLDCSKYAEDFVKNSIAHLSSPLPATRDHALKLVTSLAAQCTDPGPVGGMMTQLLAALKSTPNGKLTIAEHRSSILAAIGVLCNCPLSLASRQQLARKTILGGHGNSIDGNSLLGYLKNEVHVGTACVGVGVLVKWCGVIGEGGDEVPTLLLEHIKAIFSAKTSTPLRPAYLHCILALCKTKDLTGTILPQFIPTLHGCVEKAAGKSAQAAALEEGLVAVHVLLELQGSDNVSGQVWSLASSKQLLSHRLTTTASDDLKLVLVKVAEKILTVGSQTMKPTVQREWVLAVLGVFLSLPWSSRRQAASFLATIAGHNPEWSYDLIGGLEAAVTRSEFNARAVLEALQCLATPTHPQREAIAGGILLLSHHPQIVAVDPNAWLHLLRKMELKPHPFVTEMTNQILSIVLEGMATRPDQSRCSLQTLLCVGEECLVESVVGEVCRVMGAPEVVSVTTEDMEIFMTPPTRLWHHQLWQELHSSMAVDVSVNMRREGKLYSFEDQKWDAEMRAEMERKKTRELLEGGGGGGEGREKDVRVLVKEAIKLSQKQKDSILGQLAVEEATREKLLQWDWQLSRITSIVEEVGGVRMIDHVTHLTRSVLDGLKSPLGRSYCSRLWTVLSHGIIGEWALAQRFAVTSLSILTSSSSPPSSIPRLLDDLQHHLPPSPLHSHTLHTLTLPILRCLLLETRVDSVLESAVAVLCKAIERYTVSMATEKTTPTPFPEGDTLKLLLSLISWDEDTGRSMRIKKSCVKAFISLLQSLSSFSPEILSIVTSGLSDLCPLLRKTTLQALMELGPAPLVPLPPLKVALLVTRHDSEEEIRTLAESLWESLGYSLTEELGPPLLQLATSSPLSLQLAAALALNLWLKSHPHQAPESMEKLLAVYKEKRVAPPPKEDNFGRTVYAVISDPWECRVGVARALEQLPSHMTPQDTLKLLKFTIPGALSDPSPDVLAAFMSAAKTAIGCHGADIAGELMEHCETCLQSAGDTRESDVIRQSIVVLMGTLARHLDKGDPKVKAVVNLLLSNLDTPSQTVQEAIAGCVPPLAAVIKPDADSILSKLLDKLLESTSYSQRRGAAYGLAGLVKGLGIPSLKQHGVMPALQEAIKNKKNYRHREGSLFAFECLCDMLGRLFEPYVVHLLPDLLLCFGDGNQYVREATDRTARTIMAHLSSHGVKLILPSLLTALEEDSWRTKAGSAELLGAMAFCAPKQLSSCLPSIVPRLMEVLADSHSKVQNAGNTALKQIGSVIKNPEIQVLVPILLDALTDPSTKAHTSLQSLLETEFVHVIDPPSLALIMPTLKRTLELRSTESKKMAAQIIGNMYSLTDKKDLAPYLSEVLPGLKSSLVDPVPEVRRVCAKALGAMVRGMGDETLAELLPWLLETLQSESSAVDRSGAAQGLSEVLLAQGYDRLSQLMPRFIDSSQDQANPTHVRDGYLMLFVYLPIAFGDEFTPFLADLLPCILKGLADESEFIRDTSLQAGQTVVNRYGDTAVELFLPELERGLFDNNWRIRCSSIQLLGDLLYKVSGLSGKMSTESEEDDNFGTEEARMAIIRTLGEERRHRVLAGLYMGRSDVALMVRQAALHVWKVVVTHTVRTLREILPTLISLLLTFLGSESSDKSKVAARTLGDLVRKLGERVLPEIIPMLERGLKSTDPKERQGVCIGLSEIIQQTSRDHILLYMESLLPTVRDSLCDAEEEVRAAAAQTFNSLHNTIGPRILDDVLTPLLDDLSSRHSEVALDGLKQVMAVKSRVVLPHIVPQLVKPPVNARALALLSSVAGDALHHHLHRIIPALISSLVGEVDQGTWEAAEGVVLSVQREPGLATLIEELVKAAKKESPETRAAAMGLLLAMCSRSSADLSEHVPQLIIFVTEAFNDPSDPVCERAWLSLEALVKRVNYKELPHYIGYLRKALKTAATMLIGDELRGFSLKGITPCLTMLKEGLITGSPDEKEEAARVLIDVIHLSSAETLSAGKVVMLIAGPLIRVLGDRYGWNIKVATLEALVELIRKVGAAAKSFLPQLQTSYLKALGDVNRPVRVQAVTGLTELLPLSVRVDPVFNELHNGVKRNEDPAMRLTVLQALHGAMCVAGGRMSEKHKTEILTTLLTLHSTAQEGNRLQAAQCTGVLCSHLSDDQLTSVLRDTLLRTDGESDWSLLQARATSLSAAVEVAAGHIGGVGMAGSAVNAAVKFATSDRIPVCVSGLQALGSCINHFDSADPSTVLSALTQGLGHSSTDIRIAACDTCGHLQRTPDPLLAALVPLLLGNTQEKNTAVQAAAKSAIMELLVDRSGLEHCMAMLDGLVAKRLENLFNKLRAKMAKDM